MTPEQFRDSLDGPVFGLPTFFRPNDYADYAVDCQALAQYVTFLVDAGARFLLRTYGTAEFISLSGEEIRETTRVTVEAAAGRALVIGETGAWNTARAVEFARWAEGIGLDALMVTFPYHGSNYTTPAAYEDAVYGYFEALAQASSLPLLLHPKESMPPYSLELLRRLAQLRPVVAGKYANDDVYAQFEVIQALAPRLKIISGGSMRRAIQTFAHGGGTAYLTGVEGFRPELGFRFHDALQAGDLAEANRLAWVYETPFLNKAIELGSWGAALKAGLELCGLPGGPMRPPAPTMTAAQKAELAQVMRESGLIE